MYRIPDLQYFQLKSLDIDWSVYIKLPSCTIKYIVEMTDGYYLKNCTKYTENDAIFTALGIDSPRIFVMNIVGYECSGAFPEVKTQEDLLKVIVALDKECIKKFGDKNEQSKFKDGDYVSIMQNNELLFIMIFKQRSGNTIYRYANYSNITKNLYLDEDGYTALSSSKIMRYATEEEQKILDDALAKEGLVWNPTYKELVHISTTAMNSCETRPIFKVGDVVRIKPRTKEADCYRPMYTDYMVIYAGKIATITRISDIGSLILDINPSYYWAPEILEKVTNDKYVSTEGLIVYKEQDLAKFLKPATSGQEESEKINLFPKKKHYQFNFLIN